MALPDTFRVLNIGERGREGGRGGQEEAQIIICRRIINVGAKEREGGEGGKRRGRGTGVGVKGRGKWIEKEREGVM